MVLANAIYPADEVWSQVQTFNDNGAWCWYQDERVVVDRGNILFGSIAHKSGKGGADRDADVDIVQYSLLQGKCSRVVMGNILESDDHNVTALLVRPDGRYLAVWARHHRDKIMHWNLSEPGNGLKWEKEKTQNIQANLTYSNLFRLSAENSGKGRTYNFHRGLGFNPNCMISDDDGTTWKYGGRLFEDKGRPYVKYASNNQDVIYFANTEQHPRDFNNSIYCGYVKAGKTYDCSGKVLDDNLFDTKGPHANTPTRVFQGDKDNVAWISDLHVDASGHPFLAFSVQKNSAGLPVGQGGNDHRYHYARFDGSKWSQYEIAYAGTRLYPNEDDYTGNIALDPDNPDRVFISTDANPKTGNPLISSNDNKRHYEIFEGLTEDKGKTWRWTPVTQNSTLDNIRPAVPIWHPDSTALLWVQGTYKSYTNFNCKIVGILLIKPLKSHSLSFRGNAKSRTPENPSNQPFFRYDILGRLKTGHSSMTARLF